MTSSRSFSTVTPRGSGREVPGGANRRGLPCRSSTWTLLALGDVFGWPSSESLLSESLWALAHLDTSASTTL